MKAAFASVPVFLVLVACAGQLDGVPAPGAGEAATESLVPIVALDGSVLDARIRLVAVEAGSVGAEVEIGDRIFDVAVTEDPTAPVQEGRVASRDEGVTYEYLFGRDVPEPRIAWIDDTGAHEVPADEPLELADVVAVSLLQAVWSDLLPLRDVETQYRQVDCHGWGCCFVCDSAGTGIGGCSDWRLVCPYLGNLD